MITAEQIIEQQFNKSVLGGFKCDEVDIFLEEVAKDVKQLTNENTELQKKLGVLASRIEEYKRDEEYLKNAILNSQKLSEITNKEAQNSAKTILEEANSKASKALSDAEEHAQKILADAKIKADRTLDEAIRQQKAEIKKLEEEYYLNKAKYAGEIKNQQQIAARLKDEVAAFKTSLLTAYRNHVEMLTHLPEFTYPAGTQPAPVNMEKESPAAEAQDTSGQREDNSESTGGNDAETGENDSPFIAITDEQDTNVEKTENAVLSHIEETVISENETAKAPDNADTAADAFADDAAPEDGNKTLTFEKIKIPEMKVHDVPLRRKAEPKASEAHAHKENEPKGRDIFFRQINVDINSGADNGDEKDKAETNPGDKEENGAVSGGENRKRSEAGKSKKETNSKYKNLKFGVDYDIFNDDDDDEEDIKYDDDDMDDRIFSKRKK